MSEIAGGRSPQCPSPTFSSGSSSPSRNPRAEGYEQNRMEVAALHEALQKKTFTRWMNSHLDKANQSVDDIYVDLGTGEKLALLLTLLTDEPIRLPEKGKMRFHKVNNTNSVLEFIKSRKIKLVGIGAEDIIDGKKNLILGLIWTIILNFQISMIVTEPGIDPKKEIIDWAKHTTEGRYDLNINDLTTCWTDGLAFAAIIHRHRPELIDITKLDKKKPIENMAYAFKVAQEELNVMSLLEPEDLAKGIFDEKCTMTYLSMLKHALPKLPAGSTWTEKDQLRHRYDEVQRWVEEKRVILSRPEYPETAEDCKRELNIVNRISQDCKSKANEVVNIQKFEEKIEMMASVDSDAASDLDFDGLKNQIHSIKELSTGRSDDLARHQKMLERAEEIVSKANSKLVKIEAELKILAKEAQDVQKEISSSEDSKKLEKLGKRKEAAEQKAENNAKALKEVEMLLATLPDIECKAVYAVKDFYIAECDHLNQIYETLAHLQPQLPDIDSLIEWVQVKTEEITSSNFPSELTEVRQAIGEHTKLHQEIEQFSQHVVKCQQVAKALTGEQAERFIQRCQILVANYGTLRSVSEKRHEDLRLLEEVLNSAKDIHNEIEVLEVREKIRKWNPQPKPQTLQTDLKVLNKAITELTPKVEKFSTECNSLAEHPAFNSVIQVELQLVENRQEWIIRLEQALETHTQDYNTYKEFNIKLDEFESEVSKAENTLAQYTTELDSYSTNCIEILTPMLTRCEQEFESQLAELNELASRAPPYHLRDNPDCNHKLNGYAIVRALEQNGVDAGTELLIASMEMKESWEVQLGNGETTMLPAAIIQLSPDSDLNTMERLNRLRERHSDLRTSLSTKLGLVESMGELIMQVEVSAQSVISWDNTSLIGANKVANTESFMEFTKQAEELLSKLPPDSPAKQQVGEKIRRARSHWSSLNDVAVSEELKERLQDLEAWCRFWQQSLNDQGPLGITVERVEEQLKWQKHLESLFPEKFQELSDAMKEVANHSELQALASSVGTQLNSLKGKSDEWTSALNILKGAFDKIAEAWEWLLQLEECLLRMSDMAMTADTQGQENLEQLRQSVLDLINNKIPPHEPKLKATLEELAEISEQLVSVGGARAVTMAAQAMRHRWDLLLTEAARLDQGLGGLTKLVDLLPRLTTELGEWIEDRNDDIGNREKVPLEISELRELTKAEDRFHKTILIKTPEMEEYSKSAETHDQIILTITQSHHSYVRTLSNARPGLSYKTEADGNATHRFQEDADELLVKWDDLVSLSEKSLEYKHSTLAELEKVMNLLSPLNALLVQGESILGEKPKAAELTIWLQKAEAFMTQKSSYEPAVGTFIEECSALISTSDNSLVETAPLEELLADFKSRWGSLEIAIGERQQDCKEQIEKLQDEKTQIETICNDLKFHSGSVSKMEVILQGISLPAASQSILDQQKIVLEKSDAELKEEERKVTELLHKLGDISANINTEIDQTEMADQVTELEIKLTGLKQSFRDYSIEILEQDVVVQPFEPQLNILVALHQEAKTQFEARQAPALDMNAIQRNIETNKALMEKLASNAVVLEKTLETGKTLLKKTTEDKLNELTASEHSLDPQIAESYTSLKEKLASLEVEWNDLSEGMQQTEQSLCEIAELAQEGYNEVDSLFKRINGLKNELAKKGPPGAVPSIVEEQLADMQKTQTQIAEIDECIEQLKDKLKINSSSPGELAEQLARMEHEHAALKHLSSDYQQQLNEGLILATKYKDAHEDLVQWLQENIETFSQWKPIGVEIQLLDIQQQSIESFKDIFLSRVEEKQTQESVSQLCSNEQRPSHETTTQQYAQLCDIWSSLEIKIEMRRTNLVKMQSLAKTFDEQVKNSSVKLDDVNTDIFNLQPNIPTEIELIRSEIEHVTAIQTRLLDTEQDLHQLNDTAEQITTLASDPQFTDQTQSVTGERDRLNNEKETSCTIIAKRLEQLNNALGLAQEIKSEGEVIGEWVSSAGKHLGTEYVIRGVSGACTAELDKINSFHETAEETQSRVRGLEQLGRELAKDASDKDKAKVEKFIASVKSKVEAIVNKEENIMANLQDALKEAESFESMCKDMASFIEHASAKLEDIKVAFKDAHPEDLEALLEKIKDLLLEVVNKQIDMEKITEKGMDMSTKCPKDDDELLGCVSNLQQQYYDLQENAENMQREMDQAFLKAGELRKTTENLINWLKEANSELDKAPPLIAELEAINHALTKHRSLGTQIATKTSTIESVLQTLPSMAMTAEADELGSLVKIVKEKVAFRSDKIMRAQKCFKQFEMRESSLRESIEAFMDQLDSSESCYGMVTVVEEISIQHEALLSETPALEQMLDDMKTISMNNRTDNLIDDPTILEAQLEEISQLWDVFTTRANLQSEEIHEASIVAQRQASLYTNLFNWIEPTYNELLKNTELTPSNLEAFNKRIIDMESGLEQHRPQYEELIQLYEVIESRAHPSGLGELIEVKEALTKNWVEIDKLLGSKRKDLEAATEGIEEIMRKLLEISQWTEGASADMERKSDEPIPSSNEDLPIIEDMIAEHDTFMEELGSRHSDLEPVNRIVKALQKTEKGKEMEERRKKVNKQMQVLWVHAAERQRLLKEAKDRIMDRVIYASFDFQYWLDQFKTHIAKQKMREADIFRKADIINHTYLPKEEFVASLKNTGFNCKIQELELVAAKFQESNNLVNVDQFMKTFKPRIKNDPRPEKVVINEHVMKEVSKCSCEHKFRVDKKETAGGLMYQFGNNKVWRLVRILSNSVMVRVGGGWEELDKFLMKQDPCRSDRESTKHLHGRINSDIFNFEDKNKMLQIHTHHHSKLDPKTKLEIDSKKDVNITFHDPAIEETPLKDVPVSAKKLQSQASPSLKKKLEVGAAGASATPRLTTPTSISSSKIPVRSSPRTSPATQGASGTSTGAKSLSRNSSFKEGRGSATSTPDRTTRSKTNEPK